MNQVVILSIEDEQEVRDALLRDLRPFSKAFRVEMAEDVKEAEEVIRDCEAEGDIIGLILCDHVLPGEDGVDFLVRLNEDSEREIIRKVLVTGQAGHEETIRAINMAGLDYYIAKPWTEKGLHEVVRHQLTNFVLESELELLPYVELLEGERLMQALSHQAADR